VACPVPPPAFREARSRLGIPLVIKPLVSGGASLGFAVVRDERSYAREVARGIREHRHLLLEQYLAPPEGDGTSGEYTVGILGDRVLPVCEVWTRASGHAGGGPRSEASLKKYVLPAPVGARDAARLQEIALAVHHGAGCHGLSRTDLRLGSDGRPRILEFNTLPGLTPQSAFAQACAA